jgi:hypothetical protein
MKRNDYRKPTMKVVKIRQQKQLLSGSPEGKLPGDEKSINDDWD